MSTVFSGMSSAAVHQALKSVDEQLEEKLQETMNQTLEQVKSDPPPKDLQHVFAQAHQIGWKAYTDFKSWSERTFTTSPDKELAEAWIQGCVYRFEGPRSIQRDIYRILTSKN